VSRTKAIIIGIIIAAVAIPLGIYTLSPLFVNTEINEPAPAVSNGNNYDDDAAAMKEFKNFMEMSEGERIQKGQKMSSEQKDIVLRGVAQTNGTTVNEEMTAAIERNTSTTYAGSFVGVNDGIHNVEGQVKVIKLSHGTHLLRLENFRSTNGPDLYVYLSSDKSASDFVNLGRLKGNIGNQNYEIPEGTDLSKYSTVVIWCHAFSVLFGSSQLEPVRSS
jgi:hypothetical protein